MDISDYKAGSYKQGYGYNYFLPSKINHSWIFSDPQVQVLLSKADRALGKLDAFSEYLPDVDYFIRMHLSKEATQSSRIEGTRTNIEEVFISEQDIDPEKRDDWVEVQNYLAAINTAINQLNVLPFSNRLLKNTHRTLMQGVRGEQNLPGEFRSSQNWIGVSLKNAIFVPPHHDHVIDLMSDLEKFINSESDVPHLIKIAIAHYQFETIHPFLDGNGRLGRLMIALYLASFNQLHKPALYLSDYFERNKVEYVDRMMAVRLSSDMKAWLIFFLQGVLETSKNSIQVFKDIMAVKSKVESEVLPYFSTRRQQGAQELMRHLYQSPVVTIKGVAELLNIQVNTAAALIKDFEKHGVLTRLTARVRSRLYGFSEYMAIFDRKIEINTFEEAMNTQEDTQEDIQEDTQEDAQEDIFAYSQEYIQTLDWKIKELISCIDGVLSRAEIQTLLGLKDAEYVRQKYILPALKMEVIEMTLPDKPSSKLQKYRLTSKGYSLQRCIKS